MEQKEKSCQVRRIGSVTFGITLICYGILFLAGHLLSAARDIPSTRLLSAAHGIPSIHLTVYFTVSETNICLDSVSLTAGSLSWKAGIGR